MREIKFRVWNDRYKDFSYWGFMDGHFKGIPTGSQISIDECHKLSQQFTGLKDKNGKEIYEGDLLTSPHYPESGCVSEIRWNNNMCRFQKISRWKTNRGFEAVDECSNVSISQYQIIGNIHENLNLLL